MTDSYCPAPFRHIALWPETTTYAPCGSWSHEHLPNVPVNTPNPIQHPWWQSLREKMINGEQIPGCARCHRKESIGVFSQRRGLISIYGKPIDIELDYFDINFGNLCNMKCRMCHSGNSSRWMADDLKIKGKTHPHIRRSANDILADWSKIHKLRFIGGEPMLEQEQIIKILEQVINAQQTLSKITVYIQSNGTVDLIPKLKELLFQCEHVEMSISFDGIGLINDYQRTGGTWSKIAERAKLYDSWSSKQWRQCIASSIGIFTIDGYIDLVDWVSLNLPNSYHEVQAIDYPIEQSVRNLPTYYKQELINKITLWNPTATNTRLKPVVLQMLNEDPKATLEQVKSHIEILDQLRQETLKDVNIKLYNAIFSK